MKLIIRREGADWRMDGGEEKKTVGKATLLDKTLKILIDMPLLRENGTLTEESGKTIIKIEGNHVLFLQ